MLTFEERCVIGNVFKGHVADERMCFQGSGTKVLFNDY